MTELMVSPKTAVVQYDDDYARRYILEAFKAVLPDWTIFEEPSDDMVPALQFSSYENLNFDHVQNFISASQVNSYVYRKALIRKHFLHNTVHHHLTKKPDSILAKTVPQTWAFELDYVDYFEEAMNELYDLQGYLEANEASSDPIFFILKPSMTDRGQGIAIFSTTQELRGIFEALEENEDDEEDEADERDGIVTSQLRHFVIQRYLCNPLLISPSDAPPKKFHIRAYVLAVSSLQVFVNKELLALFASTPYSAPNGLLVNRNDSELLAHLSNTCLQSEKSDENVHSFWSLAGWKTPQGHLITDVDLDKIYKDICTTTGEVFEAAATTQAIHFQTLPNAFEIFGMDFLVNEGMEVSLLEVNSVSLPVAITIH